MIIPDADGSYKSVISILYYATPQNDLYLGDRCLNDIAEDIATSRGVCGHNSEYLLRLTDFLRAKVPHEYEHHLYELDELVRVKLGLGCKNVLPWTSLITMETFHKRILRSEPTGDECREEISSSLQPAVLA